MNGIMCYFPHNTILHERHHVNGRNNDISKVETRARVQHFFLSIQKNSYCNLVLNVVGGCDGNSSYINAISICWSICFHLGSWTMFHEINSTQSKNILLLKSFIRIWDVCILLVEDFPIAKKTKHCSLKMGWTRPFEIIITVVFSLNPLKDKNCQVARFNGWMVGPCISFVANVDWITIGKCS